MTDQPADDIEEAVVVDEHTSAVAIPGPVPSVLPDPDYTESGVPTFDYVRDQIESRVATSIGAQELAQAQAQTQGDSVEEQFAKREQAGKDRLAQIREAMRKDKS